MKYLINSNIDYYETTRPIIVNGLLAAGASPEDIIFVVGGTGHGRYYVLKEKTHILVLASHRSIDYTALISVLELGMESDYWFAMHDTCAVGPEFIKKLLALPLTGPTRALLPRVAMNIGTYSHQYLLSIREKLMEVKNTNLSVEGMAFWKNWQIHHEDFFLRPITDYYTDVRQLSGPTDVYKNGTQRLIEYYAVLDFYKFKANWDGIKSQYVHQL